CLWLAIKAQCAAIIKKQPHRLSLVSGETKCRMRQQIAAYEPGPGVLDFVSQRVMEPLGEVPAVPRVRSVIAPDEQMAVLGSEDLNSAVAAETIEICRVFALALTRIPKRRRAIDDRSGRAAPQTCPERMTEVSGRVDMHQRVAQHRGVETTLERDHLRFETTWMIPVVVVPLRAAVAVRSLERDVGQFAQR